MTTALATLPGDLTLAVEGQPLLLRFSMRTLHSHTTATGTKLADLGQALADDLYGTVGGLLAAAIRCATGKPYTTDQALGLLETLPKVEQQAISEAIVEAIRIDQSPVFQALLSKTSRLTATATSGDGTSDSRSAN